MKRVTYKNTYSANTQLNSSRQYRGGTVKTPPVYGVTAADQPSTIQTKLTVGSANDSHEQQADAMADHIVRQESETNLPLNHSSSAQSFSAQSSEVQLKETSTPTTVSSSSSMMTAPASVIQQLQNNNAGAPLSTGTRGEMQGEFGTDFTHVRVHTDQSSVSMNRALHARAFTHGSNIYFNQGQYNPRTKTGKHLLAHELTHVVQQNGHSSHIQRDQAIEAPNPEAEKRGLLQASEVSTALHYNLNRFANAEELRVMRDVLGINPNASQLIDEEFVQAVAGWQAAHNLAKIDGKLGSNTVRTIVAEYRTEASRSPSLTQHANRLAIRTRPNQRVRNIQVNGHIDQFDAVLSHRNALLTLIMKIEFAFYPGPGGAALSAAQQAIFIRRFTRDVRRVWVGVYALNPADSLLDNYLDIYFTDIRIVPVDSGGHYVVSIANMASAYEQSSMIPNGPETDNTIGTMQMGDEDVGLYRGQSRPDSRGNRYSIPQYTAAHEFGHMMGLPHIHCDGGMARDCYGTNGYERSNIMGHGNRVTRGNYTPFIVAMRRITGSRWVAR